jgi:DNA-binding PucR family transcriptional regulator
MSSNAGSLESWFIDFVRDETSPERVKAWTERTAQQVLADTPEVAEDATLAALLRTSVQAHWVSFLDQLKDPDGEVKLVKPAIEFAASLAQRQIHLATLVKVYRIGQQCTWRYLIEVIDRLEDGVVDDTEVVVRFWERASAWLDFSVTASLDVFQAERDRQLQGAAAERLEWVRRALDGEVLDTREFSARVGGYPVSAYNTAILLQARNNDAVADLERLATQIAGDLGSRQPLVVMPGGRELWGWVGTRSKPDLQLLRRQEAYLHDKGIAAHVGTPGEGIEGFAVSHRESREAQRIALQAKTQAPLTLFPDVELMSLVSQSGDGGRRFAVRTLGGLAEGSETAARLRETVLALVSSGSVDEASRELRVHKNTVRYRVAQAEKLLGRPVTQSPVELALALRYYATFIGSDVS